MNAKEMAKARTRYEEHYRHLQRPPERPEQPPVRQEDIEVPDPGDTLGPFTLGLSL